MLVQSPLIAISPITECQIEGMVNVSLDNDNYTPVGLTEILQKLLANSENRVSRIRTSEEQFFTRYKYYLK
ncbi:hypothetical protein J1C67_00015 [Clostridium gasigenes]|uniref:hypothetical protein n=1 Tax=Clostridium gasigenes TaxID=94869 RepID=UPI00143839DC|nr:hypothetical protein [Clostridium gasigenes]NKF07118.1 hypothetical protein [Clostridium gasigenes]QSW19631.1 hypothetical protein J1C67_00015 [Clostridium gasigenes]